MQYDCSLCMLQYLKVEIFNYCSCLTAISFTVEKLLNLPVNTDYHCCLWRCNYQRQQLAEITFFNLSKLCLHNSRCRNWRYMYIILTFFSLNNHIPIKAIITYNCYQICSEEAIIIAVRHGHEICSEGTVIITVRSVLQGMLGSEKKVNKLWKKLEHTSFLE